MRKKHQVPTAIDRPPFTPWSMWVDETLPLELPELESGYLYLYEEYSGNGRHRRLEKTFDLRLHSLMVSMPMSYQSGQYFVIPPNEEEVPTWREKLYHWLEGNMSWMTNTERRIRTIIFVNLDQYKDSDLLEIARVFYDAYDLLNEDGSLGNPIMRDTRWIGTVEPGFKIPPELAQWVYNLDIPKFINPEWKECFQALERLFPYLASRDPYMGCNPRLRVFFDHVYVYLELSGFSKRIQIRLQTTRKREFSWRQFWNEIQVMIYAIIYDKKKEIDANRLIPWYLFASNQISLLSVR